MSKTHWVMDYETLSNCFIACFKHYTTDETKVFVVGKTQNDIEGVLTFLISNIKNKEWHFSYNGLSFDSQITHYILENKKSFIKEDGEKIAKLIYGYAQKTINNQNLFQDYPPWKMLINQVDLFKMNHWDNPAKSSSLKWIQYSMDWENVLDMPIHHSSIITTQEEVDKIIKYCINDVASTKKIMELSIDQIKLRQSLSKEYDINLYSASEPRISKELFSYFLVKKLNIEKKDLRNLRTIRDEIKISDCILPQIKFETPVFQSVLDYFNSKTIKETKGSLNYSINYKDVKTDYGLGGIHGAKESGIYKAKEGWTIMSSDVTSYYPNLAIKNGFSPAHLSSKEFLEQYEWFFEERKLIPKSDPKNYVFKIILNSTYGLSNDKNSFLFDSEFTMKITINGQLWLSKLYEMITTRIPSCIPLMQNTDGLETMIPIEYKQLYLEICMEWEELTMLSLEHDEYSKIILRDVNNYIAVYKNGKTKCKGSFEYKDLALHKNKSFLIIPKAIYAYLIDGITPEDYLNNNQNIYDYCGAAKVKHGWEFQERSIVNGEYKSVVVQKINRYYISNGGVKLVKVHNDGREIQAEAGQWMQTICNDISSFIEKPFDELGINKQYYIDAIYKEIDNLVKNVKKDSYIQGELF